MPRHSSRERDLIKLAAAEMEESRRLIELFWVRADELRSALKRSQDLHERYHGREFQFTLRSQVAPGTCPPRRNGNLPLCLAILCPLGRRPTLLQANHHFFHTQLICRHFQKRLSQEKTRGYRIGTRRNWGKDPFSRAKVTSSLPLNL